MIGRESLRLVMEARSREEKKGRKKVPFSPTANDNSAIFHELKPIQTHHSNQPPKNTVGWKTFNWNPEFQSATQKHVVLECFHLKHIIPINHPKTWWDGKLSTETQNSKQPPQNMVGWKTLNWNPEFQSATQKHSGMENFQLKPIMQISHLKTCCNGMLSTEKNYN